MRESRFLRNLLLALPIIVLWGTVALRASCASSGTPAPLVNMGYAGDDGYRHVVYDTSGMSDGLANALQFVIDSLNDHAENTGVVFETNSGRSADMSFDVWDMADPWYDNSDPSIVDPCAQSPFTNGEIDLDSQLNDAATADDPEDDYDGSHGTSFYLVADMIAHEIIHKFHVGEGGQNVGGTIMTDYDPAVTGTDCYAAAYNADYPFDPDNPGLGITNDDYSMAAGCEDQMVTDQTIESADTSFIDDDWSNEDECETWLVYELWTCDSTGCYFSGYEYIEDEGPCGGGPPEMD
jgi:hypothetical protein